MAMSRPASSGLGHALIARDLTQILAEGSGCRYLVSLIKIQDSICVKSQAINAWPRPVEAGRNRAIRFKISLAYKKYTVVLILGAMNNIFHNTSVVCDSRHIMT